MVCDVIDRYAFYSIVIVIVYVIGLPLAVFVILYRRRHKLFGDVSDPFVATTRSSYGFLYEVWGLLQIVPCEWMSWTRTRRTHNALVSRFGLLR